MLSLWVVSVLSLFPFSEPCCIPYLDPNSLSTGQYSVSLRSRVCVHVVPQMILQCEYNLVELAKSNPSKKLWLTRSNVLLAVICLQHQNLVGPLVAEIYPLMTGVVLDMVNLHGLMRKDNVNRYKVFSRCRSRIADSKWRVCDYAVHWSPCTSWT